MLLLMQRCDMRTTVTIDEKLLEQAEKYTGVKERSTLIRRDSSPSSNVRRVADWHGWAERSPTL
jgi:hypothetical protein